jgi:hypothetical protein
VLASQVPYCLSHASSPFSPFIFKIESCLTQSGLQPSYFLFPAIAGIADTYHQAQFFLLRWRSYKLFLLMLALNVILSNLHS